MPESTSSIVAAVVWIRGALLGSMATLIAVICIAGTGFQFLTGRVPARRATTVILGCFILFSAASIANALSGLVGGGAVGGAASPADAPIPLITPSPHPPSREVPDPFDPYSGH